MKVLLEAFETFRLLHVRLDEDTDISEVTPEFAAEKLRAAGVAPGNAIVLLYIPCPCIDDQGRRCGLDAQLQSAQGWPAQLAVTI